MEGSHSPFGFIWQIASATGWTTHRIMWGIPYVTLLLMMQDAPRYMSGDEKKKKRQNPKEKQRRTKGQSAIEFFQTQLNVKQES